MALVMLPFYDSDDFGYELITTKTKTNLKPSDAYADFCGLLYGQILEAQAQHRKSLVDLPVDLIISILVLSAASCRSTAKALALTSPWISDVSLPGRLAHVSIRTIRELSAFNELVCSSPHAAGAVRTLWIATNSPLAAEQALIPDVLRACVNLGALACKVGALEALCAVPFVWPSARPLQLTLLESMHTVWNGARGSHWPRILDAHHGIAFLNNLTHLHLPLYQQEFVVLPHLTHLALGYWPHSGSAGYTGQIRDFARALDKLSLRLVAAVLVLWRYYWPRINKGQFPRIPWHTREMVQTARECSTNSKIM
ncbi:hypothetical protein C8R44DRAFT_787274, partial [Mycena epipterygia]